MRCSASEMVVLRVEKVEKSVWRLATISDWRLAMCVRRSSRRTLKGACVRNSAIKVCALKLGSARAFGSKERPFDEGLEMADDIFVNVREGCDEGIWEIERP